MPSSVETEALAGRAAELEVVAACIERAAAGRFQAVLVEGEAGIGKTRLLDAALGRARERGFRVFAGRSDEVERARPFGPIVEAFDCTLRSREPRQAEIARLLAGDPRETGGAIELTRDPGAQFRIVDAVVDLVEEAALAGPVTLALDDLQWADASTVLTLRSLARRLAYLPILVFATLRALPRAPDLDLLIDALARAGAPRLELGSLPEDVVAQLVRQLTGAEPGAGLLAAVAGAAGNPLFVTELVRALDLEGAIEIRDGHADVREPSLPPSLRLTILRRLSFLDEEALQLLRVAAALGSTFSLRDVATVLARSATGLLQPVHAAIRAGVLEEREGRLRFRHDLIREAIYRDLPEDARAALHLEAGRRLAAASAPAFQIAEQFGLGARPGDTEAVQWLQAAAREAARGAPTMAAGLLERALEVTGDADERRLPLLADLVPILLWAGRPQDAEARAREGLAAQAQPELEGGFRLGLVGALTAQGRVEDVIEEVRAVMGRAAVPATVGAQLQAEAANAFGIMDALESAEQAAREAVALGSPVGSEGAAKGLLVLSDIARVRGMPQEALAHAEEAHAIAAAPNGRLSWPPEVFLAMALQQLDRFEEAHRALREGRRADEQLGNVSYLPVYHYEEAALLFHEGRWDDSVAQAQTGLDLADEVGLEMLLTWPHRMLALIALHRDELDAAVDSLAAIERRGRAESAGVERGLIAEARGDPAGALAAIGGAWNRDTERGVLSRRRALGPHLVRLALAVGDRSYAEAVAAGVEEAAALTSIPSLEGAALRCRGLVDEDPDLLRRSVEAYERGPRAFERAEAREDAATALGRAGRAADATALFDEALGLYSEVGARRDAARALASMRSLGLGRKRRGARKRPRHGWESLTPSELEVVRLAAEGLTNPQVGQRLYISPRTVQTHLSHAFRKLDISSRVELAVEAARRGAA